MEIDIKLITSLIIPTIVAIVGWIIGHKFTSNRSLANKRRELRTEYLLEAYRKLERATNPRDPSDTWNDIESAIADIQLLGTPIQVTLARKFAKDMGEQNHTTTMPLLLNLRESLRAELELETVGSNSKCENWIHIFYNSLTDI